MLNVCSSARVHLCKRKKKQQQPCFLCIFTCGEVDFCECVKRESGRRGTTPCVMSCEPPLSPSSTVVASVPLIPPKNTKAGTVFTIGYEMASSCVPPCTVHGTRRTARCPLLGGSLQCTPRPSHDAIPVLSLNTLGDAHIGGA